MNVPTTLRSPDEYYPVTVLGGSVPFPEEDDGKKELRLGWIIVGVFFGLFLGWSLFARLDSAAYAMAEIAVSGNRRVVQHKDGGIIASLNVREGQRVKAGQVLMTLAPQDVGASERSIFGQVVALEARRSRLAAERDNGAGVSEPAYFRTLQGEDRAEAMAALELQRNELAASRRALAGQKSVLADRAAQARASIQGFASRKVATDRQSELIAEELASVKKLAEKGWVSTTRVRELERAEAELQGNSGNLSAASRQAGQQIAEYSSQAGSVSSDRLQSVAKELQDVDAQLADLHPKLANLREQLAGTKIRATADGQIVGLVVHTVGGVVTPGQKLMEIVPDRAPLILNAKINPGDADDLYVGQKGEVRITALHERNLPVLDGEITRLSADSFADEKTGQTFYTAELTVPESELAEIDSIKGLKGAIRPGLPAEVLIPLRKRTAFQYMVEPITQMMWRSFREH